MGLEIAVEDALLAARLASRVHEHHTIGDEPAAVDDVGICVVQRVLEHDSAPIIVIHELGVFDADAHLHHRPARVLPVLDQVDCSGHRIAGCKARPHTCNDLVSVDVRSGRKQDIELSAARDIAAHVFSIGILRQRFLIHVCPVIHVDDDRNASFALASIIGIASIRIDAHIDTRTDWRKLVGHNMPISSESLAAIGDVSAFDRLRP